MADEEKENLLRLLEEKNKEIERLRAQLNNQQFSGSCSTNAERKDRLSNEDIARYSRQLILPEIGVQGQLKLCNSSALIVGAGGLGCPVAVYLAAAGVGRIGLVDYDEVEVSNLHRQVLHTECRVGTPKVDSIAQHLLQLNSAVQCVPYHLQFDSSNAMNIIEKYDIVVDATDNVATRYLLNDACVLSGKPLVSGSALRFEGQLTVYNYDNGPCYRCLYPTPPPPETVNNCSDAGVLGAVPGMIGTLQALEVIKILTGSGSSFSQKMLMFDGMDGTFLKIKLRGKQKSCAVCGELPTIKQLIDYEQFCGSSATDKTQSINVLNADQRISVKEYKDLVDRGEGHLLIDTREPVEFEICSLPNSVNIPLKDLSKKECVDRIKGLLEAQKSIKDKGKVYLVCKQGNDSQLAVQALERVFGVEMEENSSIGISSNKRPVIQDIKGGLQAWTKQVDQNFPRY